MNIDARDFGRLEQKADNIYTVVVDLDKRLRALELRDSHSAGRNSVFGAIAGLITGAAGSVLTKFFT